MIKIITIILTFLIFPATCQTVEGSDWKSPRICVFGMPSIGNAVRKGNDGLIVDILSLVYKPDLYEVRHKDMPYIRAMTELKEGTIQCSLNFKSRANGTLTASKPIAIYDLSVAYRQKQDFKDISSLAGKRVSYMHGFDLQSLLSVKFKTNQAYDLSSAMQLLDRGHVDYVLGDEALIKTAIFEGKLPLSDFAIFPVASIPVHMVFSPNALGKKLLGIYETRMAEITASGELEELVRSYDISEKNIRKIMDAAE